MDLGLVVLTNSESALTNVLANKTFDVFLGVPKRDWSGEVMARSKRGEEDAGAATKRLEDSAWATDARNR